MSEPHPHLLFQMKHRLGTLSLDVSFELTQPWTILFGPSGSGKTTILRAIAGFIQPSHTRIILPVAEHSRVIADTATGISVVPHKRPVRWAAQRPALFPHKTVRENLAYSSEIRNVGSAQAVDHAMERFHLTPIAGRKPSFLSGGEQQRVSIARAAIAASGRLLLLDEPFNGLDAPLRDELLVDLRTWLAETKTPVLSVTHDIAEAFQLNAEVLKLHHGRITAQGPAALVLAEERTRLLTQLETSS